MSFELHRDQLSVKQEKAVLVSVALPSRPWITTDPFEELAGLAETAGAQIVGTLMQKRQGIHPGTYIGSGKIEELTSLVSATDADVVIFDNDLSPGQIGRFERDGVADFGPIEADPFHARFHFTHNDRCGG